MNHLTVGVYPNVSYKTNVVAPKDLENHIKYNDIFRPGRAFFVNGKCLHDGFYMRKESINEWEDKLNKLQINMSVLTTPYV